MTIGRYTWIAVQDMWGISARLASMDDMPEVGMPVLVHRKDDSKSVEIISKVFEPVLLGPGRDSMCVIRCLVQTSSVIRRKPGLNKIEGE